MKFRETYFKEVKDYASHTPEVGPEVLDCSQGVNPYGPTAAALEAIKNFDPIKVANYPHSHAAVDGIINYWKNQVELSAGEIMLVDGSVGGLYTINGLFAIPGAEVIGFMPSFTDMIVNVELQGMKYIGIPPADYSTYSQDVDALLAAINEKTSMVYIDNPNNPTGQLMPKADIIRILEKAKQFDVCVLVDEAYGDFVSKDDSAISELHNFDNLIVLRTFSKGLGLAWLRAGYIIASKQVIELLGRGSNPYTVSEVAREAIGGALSDDSYALSHAEDFASIKQAMRAVCGNALSMMTTDDRVPICTLRHRDDVDLQALLIEAGVLAVSGADFDCMDGRCVRVRCPKAEYADRLINAVKKVNGN